MAFASELLTRIPKTPFMGTLGITTGIIGLIGGACFYYRKDSWEKEFGAKSN